MDPVSLILAALVSGAAAGLGETASTAVKDAYGALRQRLQRLFDADPLAKSTLEQYTASPDVWEKPLRVQISRFEADKDAQVLDAAERVMRLVDAQAASRTGINIGPHAQVRDVGDQADIQLKAVSARDIKMKIDRRKRRTNIALGGGLVAAAALLFIWYQYSTGKAAADELSAYQRGVVATCDRIRSGTPDMNPQLGGDAGIFLLRRDILAYVEHNDKVQQEQVAALLQQSYPATLADEREAVRTAETDLSAAASAALDEIHGWRSKVTIAKWQAATTGDPKKEPVTALVDAQRRLGDNLTRLAGTACSIE